MVFVKKLFQKRWIQVVVFALLGYSSYKAIHAYDRRTEGFTIDKIHSTLPFNAAWEVPVSKEQLENANTILAQPFHYLGRGFQCYAFESADGKYVLKFFRHQRMRLPEFVSYIPETFPFIKDFKARKEADFEKRKRYLFLGIKVGFQAAPSETALLFVHLNKTQNQHGTVKISDKVGNEYVVELDKVEFMLQRKAVHIKPTIDKLMAEGKVDEAKERLSQIYALLVGCAKKGVQDTDGALIRKNNLGFLDDHAIYIDSGKLTLKESIKTREGFSRDLKRLRPLYSWLKAKYPTLATHFDEQKQKAINEL